MIRILFLLPLISLTLFSQDVEVKGVDTQNRSAQTQQNSSSRVNSGLYNQALVLFRQKEYEKAYELFNQIFFDDMGNMLVNYYLGRSAYETGRYEFAISAYDRVLISEPNNTRVRVEAGQTYFKMELYTQALKEYQMALLGDMPDEVRQKVEYMVEVVKNKQKKSFFTVTTMFGISYDSNINSTSNTGAFDIYEPTTGSTLELTNEEEEGATIYQTAAIVNHKYKFSDNYFFDTTITGLMFKYLNHKEKNIIALSSSFRPTYIQDDYKVDFDFIVDVVDYGHTLYQKNFYIKPGYTQAFGNTLYNIAFKLGKVNYVEEDNKDATLVELINNVKVVTDDYGLFTLSATLGQEIEEEDVRTDVSFYYLDLNISNSWEFIETYTLASSISYSMDRYEDEDVNFLSKREDDAWDFGLTLQKSLSKSIILNFGGTYTLHDSNHEPYEYDKYTIKTSIFYSF